MTFKIFSSSTNQLVWLTRLRWAAIAGQLLVIATADHFFVGQIPVFLLWLSICTVALSNLAIQFFRLHNLKFQREIIGAILIFDTIVLTYQLGLVGGPANPFSLVYLVHVSIASLLLGAVWTWGMVILCNLCFGTLFFFSSSIS